MHVYIHVYMLAHSLYNPTPTHSPLALGLMVDPLTTHPPPTHSPHTHPPTHHPPHTHPLTTGIGVDGGSSHKCFRGFRGLLEEVIELFKSFGNLLRLFLHQTPDTRHQTYMYMYITDCMHHTTSCMHVHVWYLFLIFDLLLLRERVSLLDWVGSSQRERLQLALGQSLQETTRTV